MPASVSEEGGFETMTPRVARDVLVPIAWAFVATLLLGVAIVVGSRNLAHFDAALVGYTFAVLFATFGHHLPLRDVAAAPADGAVLAARLAGLLPAAAPARATSASWVQRVVGDFALNRFIWRAAGCAGSPTC